MQAGDLPRPPTRRPRLSVVTGTYNRLAMLQRMVESIRSQRFGGELEIVVVDGGSTDGTRDWLVRQPDIITVLEHNRDANGCMKFGWPVCYNRGFGAASSELVCMLNDDVVVEEDCLEHGVSILEADSIAGGVAFWFHDQCDTKGYRIGYTIGGRLFVNYGIYRRSLWHAVGGFDGERYRFYHADGDFSLKLWDLKRPILVANHSRVRHFSDDNDPLRQRNNAEAQAHGDWQHYLDRWQHVMRQEGDEGYWQYQSGEVTG